MGGGLKLLGVWKAGEEAEEEVELPGACGRREQGWSVFCPLKTSPSQSRKHGNDSVAMNS